MPDKIEIEVAPKDLKIAAGDSAEITATLHNRGQSVDQLTLSISGLDPSWYTLPVSSVALFPNDHDTLKIIFHPPKTAETKAASYPLQINVASQENPEEKAAADLTIEIQELPGLEIELSPQSIAGRKGTSQIILKNMGDRDASVSLKASGALGILRYNIHRDQVTVPGKGQAESTLEVKQEWLPLIVGAAKEFEFEVTATPAESGQFAQEVATAKGQFVRIPWYRTLPRIPRIRLPWLERPPVITSFKATTDDRWEFKLSWSVKRAREIKLDDEDIERQGERMMRPSETTRYVLTASNKYGTATETVEVNPLPPPEAKASEKIRASLSQTYLQVDAGMTPVQAALQLQNLGEIVDKFLVEIEGLDETWYSRSASSIALMPQASDEVQISFLPPKKKGVKARDYPFAITVRSQSSPEERTSVVGHLEVQPSVDFKVQVRPYRVSCRRKGTFRISLANTGVSDARITLDATDLDEGLNFRFKDDAPLVAAWHTIEVPVKAKPKRGSMVGEKKRYDITVTATADGGNLQSANCELHHNPFIGSWRPILRILRAVIVLGILGGIVFFALHLGGGWKTLTSSPQTWVNQLIRAVEGWFFR